MRQEAFEQLLEWLTDINGLSDDELGRFANNSFAALLQVADSGRTIEALMHLLPDVYDDEVLVQPALEQLLAAYYRAGPLRIFALQYVPTLIRCYLTAVSMKNRDECVHLEAFFLAVYNDDIIDKQADKPTTSQQSRVNMFGLPVRDNKASSASVTPTAAADSDASCKLKRKIEHIRVPCMTQSSIYHDPNKISQSILLDSSLLSRLTPPSSSCADLRLNSSTSITISIGPYQLFSRMNVENRFLILTRLMRSKMIIDTEWGAFGEGADFAYLLNEFDRQLDRASTHPKEYIFDKLVGGLYLGELVRLSLRRLIDHGVLLTGADIATADQLLTRPDSFPTAAITRVLRDDSAELVECARVLQQQQHDDCGGLASLTVSRVDRLIVRLVCEAVARRGAQLVGACLSALVARLGLSRVTVGIDGAVYAEQQPHYSQWLRDTLDTLLGHGVDVKLVPATDGSGRGAALVAAVAQHMQL